MYSNEILEHGSIVALGNFDGLHEGHMSVINAAKNMAAATGAEPCICTFIEHPLKELKGQAPPALFDGGVKDEIFCRTGIKVIRLEFTAIKDMEPEEFFNEILIKNLNAKGVCCGFDYHFGSCGAGTPELMEKLCKEAGIKFSVSPALSVDGEPISSTRIREALKNGNIELANRMLGRPYKFRQRVVDGDKRGRTWGIPTINQPYPKRLVVPRYGVYASCCIIDGIEYYGATNIGVRPTVKNEDTVTAETNILDFQGDLYGKYVDICLLEFLRPEKKFESTKELEEQIRSDIERVKVLAERKVLPLQ